MISDKLYETVLRDGEGEVITDNFNGYLENFSILINERIYVEITYEKYLSLLLFAGWLENDTFLPVRIVPRNTMNESLAFQVDKLALNGRFLVHIKGRSDCFVHISVCVSEGE